MLCMIVTETHWWVNNLARKGDEFDKGGLKSSRAGTAVRITRADNVYSCYMVYMCWWKEQHLYSVCSSCTASAVVVRAEKERYGGLEHVRGDYGHSTFHDRYAHAKIANQSCSAPL